MYNNLKELIGKSSGTRSYFLSLPVETQIAMHRSNDHIRTAFELRRHVQNYEQLKKLDSRHGR